MSGWSGESAQRQQRSVGSDEGQSLAEHAWVKAYQEMLSGMSSLYRFYRIYTGNLTGHWAQVGCLNHSLWTPSRCY